MVVGADALHRVLVGWLEGFGHRTDLVGHDRGHDTGGTP
jgi:hypothetical protein